MTPSKHYFLLPKENDLIQTTVKQIHSHVT